MQDILIVEDGLHERLRLERLFCSANYSVKSAETAKEAEYLIQTQKFRLVILDIGLEDQSGSVLFQQIKKQTNIPFTIVLTGNPSAHLKQRFLDEGAHSYIVKASAAAANEALLSTVRSLLGEATLSTIVDGIPLSEFVQRCLDSSSRNLFTDVENQFPPCRHCGSREFRVSFTHKTQLPPYVEGQVVCVECACLMDPEVG